MFRNLCVLGASTIALTLGGPALAADMKPGPADGFDIHVMAVKPEVLQCLLFESTDPNAVLTDVEYFVAKPVSRSAVPLDVWNKFYHDHEVEIATGRVQVLDMPDAQAKEVAAAAAKTDGIIFHLKCDCDVWIVCGGVDGSRLCGDCPRNEILLCGTSCRHGGESYADTGTGLYHSCHGSPQV